MFLIYVLTRLHSGSEESVVDDQSRKRTGIIGKYTVFYWDCREVVS